jgi:hypothetical protein
MYPIEAVPEMFRPIMKRNPAGILADLYRDLGDERFSII